jgi:ABC-type multidrug transport system fused ATPase/permease subunit
VKARRGGHSVGPWDHGRVSVRQSIRRALGLLTSRDRRLLGVSVAIQMATAALDLVGVLLIGLVGALSVTTVQSQPPPEAVSNVVDALGLQTYGSQELVVLFAAAAAAVLLTKSVVSSYLTRRVFIFLANRQALVSARLAKALLSRPLTFVQRRSSQETAFALINGASAATMGILGQTVIILTELAVLIVLGVALLWISPWVAAGSIVFFVVVAYALQRAMGGWASRAGEASSLAEIQSLNAVQEALSAYREITVSDRRPFYVDRIQDLRWRAAKVAADTQFIGMFPKYMFEAALVIGGFALAGVLFMTQDSVAAVGTLALFLAAGTRVMPSLLRLQGATLGLRGAAGVAIPTFELATDLGNPVQDPAMSREADLIKQRIRYGNPDFQPSVQLNAVCVTYPGATAPALDGVTLSIAAGESVGLVGRSGAGKSTLADVVLGVLEPDAGSAALGGLNPSGATSRWPGGVAYVPQDVVLANDTIRANVALGLPDGAIDDELVWEALSRAHVAEYLRDQRDGLNTRIGERGVRLSGGQRQRIGIARALYTRPRLLVLDEATSALDAETEQAISETIADLEGDVTLIIIAHRLSTVRAVDQLVYLEDGRVVAQGSFQEVEKSVPALRRQAELMGLR